MLREPCQLLLPDPGDSRQPGVVAFAGRTGTKSGQAVSGPACNTLREVGEAGIYPDHWRDRKMSLLEQQRKNVP